MKLHCSGVGVRCTPLSSERQNVLSKGDQATWVWEVSAQRPGLIPRDLWQWVTSAVNGLGGLAVSVSAIAAVIAMVMRRSDPNAAGDTEPVRDTRRRQ